MDQDIKALKLDDSLYKKYKNSKVVISINGPIQIRATGKFRKLILLFYNLFSCGGKHGKQ